MSPDPTLAFFSADAEHDRARSLPRTGSDTSLASTRSRSGSDTSVTNTRSRTGSSSSVASTCPAFADGCPYTHNDGIIEWIKSSRPDSMKACPAFKSGCPFHDVSNMDHLYDELRKMPASHVDIRVEADSEKPANSPAQAAVMEMLQKVHQVSHSMKQSVGGDCPVFQQECPFKNCITSNGTPLKLELETRTWGLLVSEAVSPRADDGQEEKENSPPPAVQADAGGLARKLKEGTQEAHKAAESVHFVREFIKGRVPREIYAQLVVNLYHVYAALEQALDDCADHPLVDALYFPDELSRAPALREDAEFFHGPEWESRTAPSAATREYVQRLREVAEHSPELIVPHAYTRYFGDLSGGQVLKRAAVRGLGLPNDGQGVKFYTFRRVPDARAFKSMYRARLDALEAEKTVADSMVLEANRAFNFNTRIFQELDVLGGFAAEPAVEVKAASAPSAQQVNAGYAAAVAGGCPFAHLAASGIAMPADHPGLPGHKKDIAAPPQAVAKPTSTPLAARFGAFPAVAVALSAVLVACFCTLPLLYPS